MIVFTGGVYSDGSKDVLCSECGSFVGRLGGDEIRALLLSPIKELYCFLCDTVGADSVHPALLSEIRVTDFYQCPEAKRVIFDNGHIVRL